MNTINSGINSVTDASPAYVVATHSVLSSYLDSVFSYSSETKVIVPEPNVVLARKSHHLLAPLFNRVIQALSSRNLITLVRERDARGVGTVERTMEPVFDQKMEFARRTAWRDDSYGREAFRIMTDWEAVHQSLPHVLAALQSLGDRGVVLCAPEEAEYYTRAGIPSYVASSPDTVDPTHRRLMFGIRALHEVTILAFWLLLVGTGGLTVLTVFFIPYVAELLQYIVETFPAWGSALLLAVVGVILYAFRCRARLIYGLTEFCVGVGVAYHSLPDDPTVDFPLGLLSAALSLYIIVRGMDNIGKASVGTHLEWYWRKLFGKGF